MTSQGVRQGQVCYIPQILGTSTRLLAAAYQAALGGDVRSAPDSDSRTALLAAPYLNGDECFPQVVVLGDFLKVMERDDFDPEKTTFVLPTSGGPCRFGQYGELLKVVLAEKGAAAVEVVSPTFDNGYLGLGWRGVRFIWWAIVMDDLLRQLLHQTRPYEQCQGESDALYKVSLDRLCRLFCDEGLTDRKRLQRLRDELRHCGELFKQIAVRREQRPLIGVVGENFCRLNSFSNDEVVRRIERAGGEAWQAGFAEWVLYSTAWERIELKAEGKGWSLRSFRSAILDNMLRKDGNRLRLTLKSHLEKRPEPHRVTELLGLARPYLPAEAGLGEMTLSLGRAVYLQEHGADGILDVSPFGCMNGLVCEAVYPQLSVNCDNIPIRSLYYDGAGRCRDDEFILFLDLCKAYRRRSEKFRHNMF